MRIIPNYPLKKMNTFGVDAKAAFFMEYQREEDIQFFLMTDKFKNMPSLILGGGSNILFTKDFEGCVVYINNKGIRLIDDSSGNVLVEVAAGENWDDLITYCVNHNYGGLENLSGIPGKVGSCPIQNIGAYGKEVKENIVEVHAIDLQTGLPRVLSADECRMGYRDSIFKHELKGKVLIDKVVFRLSKRPKFNLSYNGVEKEVKRFASGRIKIKDVSEAIKNIRRRKIPDTKKFGSAGSFFKNPIVDKLKIEALIAKHPDIPYYDVDENHFKLAAAWLIEKGKWKGYRIGDAGVHDKQALILVNYGKATGKEIQELSGKVQRSVRKRFGVWLEAEVNVV